MLGTCADHYLAWKWRRDRGWVRNVGSRGLGLSTQAKQGPCLSRMRRRWGARGNVAEEGS